MTGKTARDESAQDLWTVKDLGNFLKRSERWIWTALKRSDTEPGSLPCYRLPGGAPRFDPGEIQEWVRAGCPPVATLKAWQTSAGQG